MDVWMDYGRCLLVLLVLLLEHPCRQTTWCAPILRKHRSKGIQWWNLAQTPQLFSGDPINPETPLFITPPVHPLTRRQLKLVTKHPGTIPAVVRSARAAVDECQHQFRHRRWNCPVSDASHHQGGSIFGKILKKGCMETAFIYAITSGALTYSVARACSDGSVYTCSCGQQQEPQQQQQQQGRGSSSGAEEGAVAAAVASEWNWGGCSDNVDFARKFCREFIDTNEKERDIRCAMNLHNNEAGRLHVAAEMRQECKCHGLSGSCAIKTCWTRLPPFRRIGDVIKDRFDGASKVDQGNEIRERVRFSLTLSNPNHKPPEEGDLVYFDDSPSFCDADPGVSFRGTRGRQCNATSIGIDGCDIMCCARGHRTEAYEARDRCNCVFHWCCHVTCETCLKTKARHTCL